MKVFCAYNHEYDRFLKSVVNYILCKFGDDLELNNIEEIELVKELENKNSDGRYQGNRIVLAERLYRSLPCLDISLVENSETFKGIVGTLYHEMGHATDMVRMPKLYNDVFTAFVAEDVSVDLYAVYLFLEYVAERRSSVIHTKEHDEYCMTVESGSWNRYKNAPAEMAFLFMSKILVYYIVRKEASCDFKSCFGKNKLIAEYVEALSEALNFTYSELPFDDKEKCSVIKNAMERYLPAFVDEYAR